MVSRRNFFSIIIMMAVLCGIFMFAMFVQENGSTYDVNRFVVKDLPSGENRWEATGEEEMVLLFGGQDAPLCNVVEQWCTYTKRFFLQKDRLTEYSPEKDGLPVVILLDAKNLDFGRDYSELVSLTELGIPIIFCNLPETKEFIISPELRDILGVKLKQLEVTVDGIRLFDDFFYGGPAEYIAKTEEDKKFQDFDLTVPWFLTQSGTKTYMVGVMEDESIKNEEYPCLIWRNSYKDCKVFAVCGDYMSSLAGFGILSTFMYELREYEIYPVVNAQSVIINNFPNFSEENEEELSKLYSRTPQMYFQGVMWPRISALAKTNALKLTCLFKPQYNYLDTIYPETEEVHFYLKQFKELESEAGISLGRNEGASFETMIAEDNLFYENLNLRYRYQVTFAEDDDMENVMQALEEDGALNRLVTVAANYGEEDRLLSYLTDDTTLQRVTGTADAHTYMEDFTVRSVQTALLYSNVLMDLKDAVWPQEEAHQWQHLFKEMSSNIATYWSGNSGLEQTTLSQSDFRVRKFLNMDYSHKRISNVIEVRLEEITEDVWFVLRTHDEKITRARGAKFKQLDENMYLITATNAVFTIELEPLSLKEQVKQ